MRAVRMRHNNSIRWPKMGFNSAPNCNLIVFFPHVFFCCRGLCEIKMRLWLWGVVDLWPGLALQWMQNHTNDGNQWKLLNIHHKKHWREPNPIISQVYVPTAAEKSLYKVGVMHKYSWHNRVWALLLVYNREKQASCSSEYQPVNLKTHCTDSVFCTAVGGGVFNSLAHAANNKNNNKPRKQDNVHTKDGKEMLVYPPNTVDIFHKRAELNCAFKPTLFLLQKSPNDPSCQSQSLSADYFHKRAFPHYLRKYGAWHRALWRFMFRLDCCPFLIITVLNLLPAERGSSSVGAFGGSPLSAESAGKSAKGGENNGVCMTASHTPINKDGCKCRRHCSGVITTDGDLLPYKACGMWRDGGQILVLPRWCEDLKWWLHLFSSDLMFQFWVTTLPTVGISAVKHFLNQFNQNVTSKVTWNAILTARG